MAEKTPVIFRRFPNGDIVAMFPTIPAQGDPRCCMSYMHVGQHGAADPNLVTRETRPATEPQYRDLAAELARAGYDLRVIRSQSPRHREARRREIDRYGIPI